MGPLNKQEIPAEASNRIDISVNGLLFRDRVSPPSGLPENLGAGPHADL